MDELELMNNVKEMIAIQTETIKEMADQIDTLQKKVSVLETMTTSLANVIVDVKEENETLAMGYNDILTRIK